MVEGKDKFALWLTPEAKELVEQAFRQDGCRSRSEFIEKAVRFYCGYLNAEQTGDYLPRVMGSVLSGTLDMFARRMGRLMFKQAVECNITNHLIAADSDIDLALLDRLRGRSVREVQSTNGEISLRDDLQFQRSG